MLRFYHYNKRLVASMTEYRFSKYTMNITLVVPVILATFLIGILALMAIFLKITDLKFYCLSFGFVVAFGFYFKQFFLGVFFINKNAFYHKRGLFDKVYPFSRYYVECDKNQYRYGPKKLPNYKIFILDLETGKETIITINDTSRKYQRADLKMKEEICRFSDHLRKVQS